MKYDRHLVPLQHQPTRLSDYLVGIFPALPSRKSVKKSILKGHIKVDDQIGLTGTYLHGGELITLCAILESRPHPFFELKLEVLYEDAYLAIVVKPAGIVVSGNQARTLQHALPYNLLLSNLEDSLLRPLPAHRLDFATRGVLVVGKTMSSLTQLQQMFAQRKIAKTYHAITMGEMPMVGSIDYQIDNKEARTDYRVLKKNRITEDEVVEFRSIATHNRTKTPVT